MPTRNENVKIFHTTQENYNFDIFFSFFKENFVKAGNEPSATLCTKKNQDYIAPTALIKLFTRLFYDDQIYNQGLGLKNTGQHFRIHGVDTMKGETTTQDNLAFITFGTMGTAEQLKNYSAIASDFTHVKKYLNGWGGLAKFIWFGLKDVFYNVWHLGKAISMEEMLDAIVKIPTTVSFLDQSNGH